MNEDKSQLLTKGQREALLEIKESHAVLSDHSKTRLRIRKRLRLILRDFPFLFDTLPEDDLNKIFEDLEEYLDERDRIQEGAEDVPLERVEEPPSRYRPANLPFHADEGEELYRGVVAALSFLYAGVDDNAEFEHMLEQAIENAKLSRRRLPHVNVNIEVTGDEERNWWLSRMKGKTQRKIPGGGWTPYIDRESYQELGIDNMSEDELRELFGQGFSKGALAFYDGDEIHTPSLEGAPDESDDSDVEE